MYTISEWTREFDEIGIQKLKDEVSFAIYISDNEFDNFDNEYAEIKLHRYTNMQD